MICTQDWRRPELEAVLDLAAKMKRDRFGSRNTGILQHKAFFMFFYNPSVRTRQSFECAATELGGHAQFLEPKAMRLRTATTARDGVFLKEDEISKALQLSEWIATARRWR